MSARTFTARFAHGDSDSAGRITLDAQSEAAAIREADAFVEAGVRNSTWINVDLGNGAYAARNAHGKAVGEVTRYA
jgi:hypothetical protein